MAPYYGTATAEWAPANEHRSNLVGKRKIEDEFETQSNISTQFKKLRLHHALPRHAPPPTFQPSPPSPTGVSFRPHIPNTDARPAQPVQHEHDESYTDRSPPPTTIDSDFMTVDETPHRIIISDLEAEIAQIEADEAAAASAVFLPDIDKKVSSIPERVLRNRAQASVSVPENHNTALILYRDPTSISVPEEEDVVKKAIIAARTRIRERQADERERGKEEALHQTGYREYDWELDDAMTDHSSRGDDDLDAMEIE